MIRTIRVVAVAAAVAAFASVAAPASAADPVPAPTVQVSRSAPHKSGPDNATAYWANNSMTGYCGQTDGGYVIAAQLFLTGWGVYTGRIDDYWGSKSHTAMLAYQRDRGLSQDGCAGPLTWADMQARTAFHATTANCNAPGNLDVYRLYHGGEPVYFDRSSVTHYWYSWTYLQPVGGPVGEHLYRFSDDIVVRC
jgi:hypothetical protein